VGIEITVLVMGWLLGGTVGAGTVIFAFGMGPLVHLLLPMFTVEPLYAYEHPSDGPGIAEGAL
jgi:uncharacterized membrane protein YczE